MGVRAGEVNFIRLVTSPHPCFKIGGLIGECEPSRGC